ncbi:MAG: ABC transporter permease, partial [Rhizobacter sp.]|nr:ABC transporter permease [Chlorobiales bacterium]
MQFKLTLSETLRPLLAVLLAFLLGGLLMLIIGKDPFGIYGKMLAMSLGNSYGIGQVLFRATPLILTGLAVAIPFQAGLFNIGGEGQVLMGAFACAVIGAALPVGLPWVVAVPLCLIAAMLAGSVWGGVAGLLKVHFGINEVITTIMLNFIAAAIAGYFLTNVFAVESTIRTKEIIGGARLARLEFLFPRSPVNLSLILSIGAAIAFYFVIYKTKYGYELRAVGLNAEAARYAGISNEKHVLVSMMAAGAMAGLVAANSVMGYKGYYEAGQSSGAGILGIAVAMLAGSNPLWIIFSSL